MFKRLDPSQRLPPGKNIAGVVRYLFLSTLLRSSKYRNHGSVFVVADTDEQLHVLDEALHLVRQMQPLRYNQILRDLKFIWVRYVPGSAEYDPSIEACVISPDRFTGHYRRKEDFALTIIHEATHARLDKLGVGYDETIRGRVEAICHRRELFFAKLLGDEQAIYTASYYLKNPLPYGDVDVRSRRIAQLRSYAEANFGNFGQTLANMLLWIAKRRSRKSRR